MGLKTRLQCHANEVGANREQIVKLKRELKEANSLVRVAGLKKKKGRKQTAKARARDIAKSMAARANTLLDCASHLAGEANSTSSMLVEAVKQQSKVDPDVLGGIHDVMGSGREVHWHKDARGHEHFIKGKAISMAQLEEIIIPTRGKIKQLNKLAELGFSDRYPAFHAHMTDVVSACCIKSYCEYSNYSLLQYTKDNPTVTRLLEEPGGRALSFVADLKGIREKLFEHPEYGPNIKLTQGRDGRLRLLELHAEDGTSER